ncbi:MAG: hypothetical protein P8Z30_18050 [Acidobacteriota bacterium]
MTMWKRISAVVVVLFVAVVVGLVTARVRAQGSQPQPVEVKITPNADPTQPPTVVPDAASVGAQEQVEWSCTTNCDFTVVFTQSTRKPFKDRVFSNSHARSGRPTGPPGTYEYSVIVGEGSADPTIIVH